MGDIATGKWDYKAGVSGTVVISGRILQISAIALELAGSLQINGGDIIPIPYGSTDKVSTGIDIVPKGDLLYASLVFTNTKMYFVEFVN